MTRDPKWARVREEILLFCHRMQQERLVWYTAGNISARVGEQDLVAVTPTSVPYDTMVPDDIVIMSVHGNIIDGFRKPTSEVPLHTLVYLRRPEVGGVVHTHSSAGMAMAAMGRTLPPILTGLVSAAGGSVATAPYARTGTAEMADFTASALVDRSACFLRHHGVLAIGSERGAGIQHGICGRGSSGCLPPSCPTRVGAPSSHLRRSSGCVFGGRNRWPGSAPNVKRQVSQGWNVWMGGLPKPALVRRGLREMA